MSGKTRIHLMLTAALVAAAGTPEQGSGQSARAVYDPDVDAVRAEVLHTRATELFTSPPRYAEAAALLVRAARLRDPDDRTSIHDLVVAAKLYAYAKHPRAARGTMEEAAARALQFGELDRAAHAYIDAAYIAMTQKNWNAARMLCERAERVAASPHLVQTQRDDIKARLRPALVALNR
jgi:hypothetical protein